MDCLYHFRCLTTVSKETKGNLFYFRDGFTIIYFRALCRECNEREKEAGRGRYVCHKCKGIIEDGGHIKYHGDSFHPYHFKCKRCG